MRGQYAMINKLQQALNARGEMILQRTTQFYSLDKKCPVTIYYVEKAYKDEEDPNRTKKNELFKTTSQLQVILFMRDLLNLSRGEPLPTDNQIWNDKRKEIDYFKEIGVV